MVQVDSKGKTCIWIFLHLQPPVRHRAQTRKKGFVKLNAIFNLRELRSSAHFTSLMEDPLLLLTLLFFIFSAAVGIALTPAPPPPLPFIIAPLETLPRWRSVGPG